MENKRTSTVQLLQWRTDAGTTDIVLADHAVTQAVSRYFGGTAEAVDYCRELFTELPLDAATTILAWRGFPGQPRADRSIYLRDFRHGLSLPLIYKREDNKLLIPTIMKQSEQQRTIPCGGESRASLVLDYHGGGNVVVKLRIGKFFYADTEKNRAIPYTKLG